MKKVGIITHWTSLHNYGQKLQAYALEEYLKENGFKPMLIKYRWDGLWWRPLLIQRYISTQIHYLVGRLTGKKNWAFRKLDYFSKQYLNITNIKTNFRTLTKFCQDLSIIITGSDQVWRKDMYYDKNKHVHYDALDAFTLSIPCRAKKISYAASAGHFFPPAELENELIKRIKKLDAVSVRERNLSDYLSAHGVKSTIVPDPVFLISKNKYLHLAEKNPVIKCKCVLYSLDNDSCVSMKEVANVLYGEFKEGYTYISGSNGCILPQIDFPTISEWLAHINNSELVITNSFHCVAFSIIFNTPFYYIPLSPEAGEKDDRIETLLNYVNIKGREINSIEELKCKIYENNNIDWNMINIKLNEYSNIGRLFLKETFQSLV